jgi:hypothetical protein
MGHAIPQQHPAVVLRSQFNLVRWLLAAAMVALVGMTIAVVILANDDTQISTTSSGEAVSAGSNRDYSGAAPTRKLDGATDIPTPAPVAPGTRYDGGPDEGTRSPLTSPLAPGTRYDGGPEEGSRGVLKTPAAPDSRYDGGPEEGTRGPGFRTN